ncbi:uncharacterized protein [Agelaius tricolor]|uniref:uncharacterized protein n=1 Tax=Agelaius tricolor TaxID=9191 RepID=UPI0039F1A709
MMPSSNLSVEIEVINKTQNITLKNPRTHFYSGHSLSDPQPLVPPGSSSSCKFTSSSRFWGCTGVLAYEADSFTMAICFSNAIHDDLFPVEMVLELSLDKVHRKDLETTYDRLVGSSKGSANSSMFPCVILTEDQQKAQLSHGPVTVTATMARGRNIALRVEVEEVKTKKPWDVKSARSKRSEILRQLLREILAVLEPFGWPANPAGTSGTP